MFHFLLSLSLILTALTTLKNAQAEIQSASWNCKGIAVSVNGPEKVRAGEKISYEIHLVNSGDCRLEAASLIDYIPRRSVFQNATPVPSGTTPSDDKIPNPIRRVEWKPLGIGPQALQDYRVDVQVLGPADRWVTNSVCFEHGDTGRICDALDTYITP